tara:strand:+ start:5487 stop:6014 length:528 start_codon:yes stop_codon:yes gene_type:complete
MLSIKRQDARNFIKNTNIIKELKNKSLGGQKSFTPLNYRFVKEKILMGVIALLTVFLLSLWFYISPEKDSVQDYKTDSIKLKLSTEESMKIPLLKKTRSTTPIVKITPRKISRNVQNKNGYTLYNQAVMNDRKGAVKKAISLYSQALKLNNPKIQKNAKAIQLRINYLIHQTESL